MRSLPLVAIRRRAALALLLLTVLTGGMYASQRVGDERASDATAIVDLTSRQAMLTERVGMITQALAGDLTPGQRSAARRRLESAIELMTESHHALVNGDPDRDIERPTDPKVIAAYRGREGLDRQVKDFLNHAEAVAEKKAIRPRDPDVGYVRAAAQTALLDAYRKVVTQERATADEYGSMIAKVQTGAVAVTLLVLFLFVVFLLQPMLSRLKREVAFVEVLQDIAVAANAATSIEEPTREALQRVCSMMKWPVGHAYLLDRTNGVLASSAIWHLHDPGAHEGFRKASEAIKLSPGVDLPGRVLVQRRPVWISDVTEDHNFPRKAIARQHGLRAAAAFPVLVQDQVVAVLEFFSMEAVKPDRGLLEVMGHVGTQLGRVSERVNAEQRLLRQARHDGLTDLVNRASFHERVRLALAAPRNRVDDGVPAVLFIDLDDFKQVNDGLGHDVGDRLLREVAARIASVTRDADAVARLGGDEFAVLLSRVRVEEEAIAVADRITQVLASPIALREDEALVGASIGIAIAERDGQQDLGALIRNADVAMYTAKARSAPYHLYTPQDDNLTRSRVELVADLRRAIAADELFLVYQPKVDLQNGHCAGVEALVRWRHPRRGVLGPDQFLDLAERSGQMRKLTRAVLDRALHDVAHWHTQGLPLDMAVNLSPSNLRDPQLVGDLEKMLAKHQVSPSTLVLEITENVLIVDEAAAAETVRQLGELGIAMAIDDFGTGHSSLTRLRDLPLAELKIDRSFVMQMEDNPDDEKIVLSTIQLAHSLNLAVVAEGAETPGVISRLTELGCDMGQGYAFAKPLIADELADWARVHGVAEPRELPSAA